MTTKLEPDVDIYGKYARASSLADFVEIAAVHGKSFSQADLDDQIDDNGWSQKLEENFLLAGQEETDSELVSGERIVSILASRQETLGDRYPFQKDDAGRVTFAQREEDDSYLGLLALTAVHAYKLQSPKPPHEVFEQVVTDILQGKGMLATNFGALRRQHGQFAKALEVAGDLLKLKANPAAAPRSRRAQDEGVDSIAHIPWCLVRSGRWSFIGQVTCGMSDSWEGKLDQPSMEVWREFLGEGVKPRVFLAVPHHIEPAHRTTMLIRADREKSILDRLSLVSHRAKASDDERSFIDLVKETELD